MENHTHCWPLFILTVVARFLAVFPHNGLVHAAAVSCLGPLWAVTVVIYALDSIAQIASLCAFLAHPVLPLPVIAETRVCPTIAIGILISA